jgi:hypothetical protein
MFSVDSNSEGLSQALLAWKKHIEVAHLGVKEVRCYRYNQGTAVVWLHPFRK